MANIPSASVDDVIEPLANLLFCNAFGEGQFLHQQPTRQFQNLLLAVRQLLLHADQVKLPQHLGDIERITGFDFVIVFTLPATPGSNRQRAGLLFLEDIVYCLNLFFTDKVTQTDLAGIAHRDHDRHVVVDNA